MKKIKNVLLVALLFIATTMFSQIKISGTVMDNTGTGLPGASIVEKGTTNGVAAEIDGTFELKTTSKSGSLKVSFIGYKTKVVPFTKGGNLGKIILKSDSNALDMVVIAAVADVAKDRETPVAASTIRAFEIQEKLGSKEFPEILNTTPSVYATKQGGGFGDARISIRGFDQNNTAVLINGVPVNDMENGSVYWSNWAGLSDVTSAMQVQRGLGSSKLAISSVGGTINVITSSSTKKQGGKIYAGFGNDNYLKTLVSYNTGLLENGLSVSTLFGRTSGDGYVYGTKFEGYSYYLALGYKPNENNDLQFTLTGAPQRHNKRGYAPSLADHIKYGDGTDPDRKYNSDWGYRNGEEETFSGNFYHKPVASLNWNWDVNKSSKLSTVVYASFGRGGSVGSLGKVNGKKHFMLPKDNKGRLRFDDIIKWNKGGNVPDFGANKVSGQNGLIQRSSMNSHNWYGVVSNFNTKISDGLTLDFGVDLRTYTGYHYRRMVDFLGSDKYTDNSNLNKPNNVMTELYAPKISNILNVFSNIDDEQKIYYNNKGRVNWLGAFSQLEYKKGKTSAFIQGGVSRQGFKRIDYFSYLDSDPKQETKWEDLLGGNIKGGINYNINDHHNVFSNAGYYLKQPNFDAVYPDNKNDLNDDLINEKVLGFEIGYGFKNENFSVNFNAYRTSWKDRFVSSAPIKFNENKPNEVMGYAKLEGVEQIHQGVELDTKAKLDKLTFNFMASIGNYKYGSDVEATYFDDDNNAIKIGGKEQIRTVYLDGKKVGDSPQMTFRLGFDYEILEGLKVDISQQYAANLYSAVDSDKFAADKNNASDVAKAKKAQPIKIPGYSTIDAGLSYKHSLKNDSSLRLRLNVNNVGDKLYISDSETSKTVDASSTTWRGINTKNRVYFGAGRTWNLGLSYNF